VFAPRETFAPSHGCEHKRPEKNRNDRGTVNMVSTASRQVASRARTRERNKGAFVGIVKIRHVQYALQVMLHNEFIPLITFGFPVNLAHRGDCMRTRKADKI